MCVSNAATTVPQKSKNLGANNGQIGSRSGQGFARPAHTHTTPDTDTAPPSPACLACDRRRIQMNEQRRSFNLENLRSASDLIIETPSERHSNSSLSERHTMGKNCAAQFHAPLAAVKCELYVGNDYLSTHTERVLVAVVYKRDAC
jgi:hypothetical protein